MDKKVNVLVFGIGQSNFILQLYGTIKGKLPKYSFGISGFRSLFKQDVDTTAKKIFEEIFELGVTRWSYGQIMSAFFYVLTKKYIYKEVLISLAEGTFSINRLKEILYVENIKAYLIAREITKKDYYSVLHFHFLIPDYIYPIKYLPKHLKVISTFWGSDLMRYTGLRTLYYQSLALNRSNMITCATYDMGNIVLSKYGRHLEHKIRYAKFIHDPKIYELIDFFRDKDDWQDAFREKYSIPGKNKIIIIGHNATPANNHLRILNSFDVLPEMEQEGVSCILPLSYAANNNEYIQEIERYTKRFKMQFIFLKDYMTWEDLAKLKLIADVMVHMPTSDGLSAALTEYYYAGGLAVTGSWLPYSTFCRIGIFYIQCDNFECLRDIWNNTLKNTVIYKDRLKQNIEIVRKEFDVDNIACSWQNIFNELSA